MSKKPRNNPKVQDYISDLPDHILHCIISHLSIDEVFRTSILSKRWIHLWKNALHFDFDFTRMVNLHKPNSLNKKRASKKDVRIYFEIVNNILCQHKGNLISGCFRHFREKNNFGDLNRLVEFLIERKEMSSLSLECEKSFFFLHVTMKDYFKPKIFSNLSSLELTNYKLEDSILSAFGSCEKLKILKMKNIFMFDRTLDGILQSCFSLEKFSLIDSEGFNSIEIENKSLKTLELFWLNVTKIHIRVEKLEVLVIDSIICPAKDLRIYAPKIRTFCCSNNPFDQRSAQLYYREPKNFLKTEDFLENCSDLSKSQSINIFPNLLTLSIDLDLNNIREILALSYALMSCCLLNTLKITIPVNKSIAWNITYGDDCALPYLKSMFWEMREKYYFVLFNKLKFVTLKGFTGKEQEVIFAKLLITKAYMMEKMYVICDSTIVDEAKDLLSLPRGSSHLSIILKYEINNNVLQENDWYI